MNVLIVDTSSWISYFKGTPSDDIDLALQEGRVYLPPIVIAEMLSAKLRPVERQRLYDFLIELPICDSQFGHWQKTGELRAELATKGLTVSTPDAHVAQCALDLEGYLVSEDAIFKKISKFKKLKLL